jgi:hypothetical protein
MAKCEFTLQLNSAPNDLISRASSAFSLAGGSFDGDVTSGNFNISTPIGKVSGVYKINGGEITIQIQDKPLLLSCSRIREELSKRIQ